MGQVTIHLPDKIAAELAEQSRQSKQSPDDLALELVERGLAVRRFRAARQAILDSLGPNAPSTDEEAFKLLP